MKSARARSSHGQANRPSCGECMRACAHGRARARPCKAIVSDTVGIAGPGRPRQGGCGSRFPVGWVPSLRDDRRRGTAVGAGSRPLARSAHSKTRAKEGPQVREGCSRALFGEGAGLSECGTGMKRPRRAVGAPSAVSGAPRAGKNGLRCQLTRRVRCRARRIRPSREPGNHEAPAQGLAEGEPVRELAHATPHSAR